MGGLTAAALCLVSLPLFADVFWRRPAGIDPFLQDLGGACVYTSDVKLNGAPGVLRAHVVPATASHVCSQLARRLRLPPDAALGGTLITHAENGSLRRVLILPSGSSDETCIVLAFDQSVKDAARAHEKTPAWPAGLPAFSATPQFTAECDATHTTFLTAQSPASPEEAAQNASQALVAAGWTETKPSLPAFKTYVSGRKTCVVMANRGDAAEQTTVSVLQREGAAP